MSTTWESFNNTNTLQNDLFSESKEESLTEFQKLSKRIQPKLKKNYSLIFSGELNEMVSILCEALKEYKFEYRIVNKDTI